MEWKSARTCDMREVKEYLLQREYRTIALSKRLLDKSGSGLTKGGNKLYVTRNAPMGLLEGLLLLAPGGTVAPVFSEKLRSHGGALKRASTIINRAKRVHSILGLEKDIGPLIPYLEFSHKKVQYYIMKGEEKDLSAYSPPHVPGITIRKAEVKDAKDLFPLRREYELEEVLLDPSQFHSASSFLYFKKALRSHIFYAAELKGKPVGTAGTNGWGIEYVQIGGVFTLKKERGKGIAGALMSALSSDLLSRDRKLCLFVKQENTPALKLYRKMGFRTMGEFSIYYFFP
jgi:predicted GNAT family acetyltransferase